MKKNNGLIIGVIIVVILLAVAAWYFFFRDTTGSKIGNGQTGTEPVVPGTNGTPSQVCPEGTTGVYPNCTLVETTSDTIFSNAIAEAVANVTNNTTLNSAQRLNAVTIIEVFVPQDKRTILAEAATGKDIVQLILMDAEKIYLTKYGAAIKLSQNVTGSGGRG